MTNQEIIDALRGLEPELRRRGVSHAGLFGSTARGESRPDSDIDILVDLDPNVRIGLFAYAGLKRYISVLLKRRFRRTIDVVSLEGLKPPVRTSVEHDLIYAF